MLSHSHTWPNENIKIHMFYNVPVAVTVQSYDLQQNIAKMALLLFYFNSNQCILPSHMVPHVCV